MAFINFGTTIFDARCESKTVEASWSALFSEEESVMVWNLESPNFSWTSPLYVTLDIGENAIKFGVHELGLGTSEHPRKLCRDKLLEFINLMEDMAAKLEPAAWLIGQELYADDCSLTRFPYQKNDKYPETQHLIDCYLS